MERRLERPVTADEPGIEERFQPPPLLGDLRRVGVVEANQRRIAVAEHVDVGELLCLRRRDRREHLIGGAAGIG